MNAKRKIEIFSAGCPACRETVELVERLACPSCDVQVLDMNDPADLITRLCTTIRAPPRDTSPVLPRPYP